MNVMYKNIFYKFILKNFAGTENLTSLTVKGTTIGKTNIYIYIVNYIGYNPENFIDSY